MELESLEVEIESLRKEAATVTSKKAGGEDRREREQRETLRRIANRLQWDVTMYDTRVML